MKKILENAAKVSKLAGLYMPSAYGGFKNRKLFDDIKTFCIFIGYPRSGHSIIGALLDAHPNMIIANELGVFMYVFAGFTRNQIYYILLKNSRQSAEAGRKTGGYSYKVDNQWQGKFDKLQVIGDNLGGGAVLRLQSRPWLLHRLRKVIKGEIKFIHVIRNPYENISTICSKAKAHKLNSNLKDSIEYYFSLCETVAVTKKQIKSADIFELRHESFISSPKTYLKELCLFLGLDASDDYLNDCASIVYKAPHKSRYDIQWDRELIDIVKRRIEKFPFLEEYSYEEI